MKNHLNLPSTAYVNKFIPKIKLYAKAGLNSKIQAEFADKVRRITWKYKLGIDTINIAGTAKVEEIQIFEIELKEKYYPEKILKVINKAIPYPILYVLKYQESFAYSIAYDDNYIKNRYYFSQWDQIIDFDFSGINLEKVYEKLIRLFIPKDNADKKFTEVISLDYEISVLETRINKLSKKLHLEKQMNKKVEINKLLLSDQANLKKLKG